MDLDGGSLVLGIDVGTSSVKAVLLEPRRGDVLCSHSTDTGAGLESECGAQGKEQDVGQIIRALNDCLVALPREKLQRVSRIGVSGQMHGVVFWKSSQDFLHEYDAAGTIQDYVVSMLCGMKTPLMSVQNAASWGYFNTRTKTWNVDILQGQGFPVSLLPPVVDAGCIAGKSSYDWCGIPQGTEVGVSLGDFQCSVFSSTTESTDAVLNISTSAQLTFSMPEGFQPEDQPRPAEAVTYFPYMNNRYLAVAASLNGGNVFAAFVGMLVQWTAELGLETSDSTIYSKLINTALSEQETQLTICPTLFGERHAPDRVASVSHISTSGLSLGHVTRALCRGLIQNIHSMLPSQRLKEAGIKRIIGSGSALTRNAVLQQEVERVFPFPVVYGKDVNSAVGAAMIMR
ncbi:sedoheptulokinase isoform 2-T2 [Mantella aurantiaca]